MSDKEVAVKANQVDLSGMSADELAALRDELHGKIALKRTEEAKEKLSKVLSTDAVTTMRAKIAKLEEEYKALPREITMTLNVPVTFKMKVDLPDTIGEYLSNSQTYSDFATAPQFIDGWQEFSATIPKNAEGLNKIQQRYLEDGLDTVVSNACEESVMLFEERKAFEKLGKKVDKIVKEFSTVCNEHGIRLPLSDVFHGE